MLRRTARLRKEYLFRKSLEEKERQLAERKQQVKETLETGKPLPTNLRAAAAAAAAARLAQVLDLDDPQTLAPKTHVDDEYAYAGVEDPSIALTTSRSPSSRLQQFVKELNLLLPNCRRINRGTIVLDELLQLCRSSGITDLLLVHEHRGQPTRLIVSHLPHGPTAHFTLSGVCLRHDLPERAPNMSQDKNPRRDCL
ncbi:U3 small nucleolar ribonucleoprotein protein, putative [Eimeria tenella]|uniref:U3 small nucleolar ribonucleoprotein protein, putative n=1 Tax=Eimeria tenella TaxID=5802 RepID=U6KXT1_EIMTE|nr:U3 small nucleolar ribonucleoprotein protein, putative [Eimeria tenella]CDJ42781.1 U3 small nucleolar ribonucleoprotein protein, putative [Eimeria tenella]|eukprot:XP_013233531.1 U3 small nucleolar ribonucleoprotein protein, putative [Eimeria tenella]